MSWLCLGAFGCFTDIGCVGCVGCYGCSFFHIPESDARAAGEEHWQTKCERPEDRVREEEEVGRGRYRNLDINIGTQGDDCIVLKVYDVIPKRDQIWTRVRI